MEKLADMTIGQALGSIAGIMLLLSIFIEITPVKFNPISSLVKWFGKKANEEIIHRLDDMEKKVNDISSKSEMNNAISCRVRILSFGDELIRGVKFSREHFDQILGDIDTYELYCFEHPDFKNNKTVTTTKLILKRYEECMQENSFL